MQGVEGGRQNLDSGIPRQPHGVAGQRQRGLAGVGEPERPALIDGGDHRLAEYGQSD